MADEAVAQDDLQFEMGFDDSVPTPPAPVEDTGPKYVQVTEDDFKKFQSNVDSVSEMRAAYQKQFDTAFGKLGGVERTLTQLTANGPAVDLTEDVVSDLAEDFPELAAMQLKSFQKFAQTIRTNTAPVNPIDIDEKVHARVIALETEALEDAHPQWREIVGAPESKTDYRQWLSKQPSEYQQKLNATNSASVIARSIDKFKSGIPKPSVRQTLIRDAITPKGDGRRSETTSNADDDFNAGFAGR